MISSSIVFPTGKILGTICRTKSYSPLLTSTASIPKVLRESHSCPSRGPPFRQHCRRNLSSSTQGSSQRTLAADLMPSRSMAEVSYKPQVSLVTGAAQGIGEAIALRLAEDGISVALNDLHSYRDALQALAKRIEAKGVKAAVVTADISQEEQVKGMVDAAVQQLGRLDVMVANAGIGGTDSILEITGEDFKKILGVNLEGVLYCYKYAALQMVKQGNGGRLIGASSVLGRKGCANMISYTASKFAIRGVTQCCAMELREHGITANAYAPGVVETRMTGSSFGDGSSTLKNMMKIPNTPSTPKEQVANWVAYIASPQSQSINGTTTTIDGGIQFD